MFRFRNVAKERNLAARVDATLEPRLNQVFAPLLSIVDDHETLEDLKEVMRGYQGNLVIDRGLDVEAAILEVVRELALPGRPSPSVRQITEEFVSRHGRTYPRTSPRWVGHILRKKLGLVTTKSHGSYVIAPSSYDKLTVLYEKYGVAEPDGERISTLFDLSEVPEGERIHALQSNSSTSIGTLGRLQVYATRIS